MASGFDPEAFKRTTRAQWQETAPAWNRWGPVIEEWLGPATGRMLDGAGITVGSRVLDVAAGTGGQTLAAARRAGPSGYVLATDISPAILDYAARAAAQAGLDNVGIREVDGEHLGVPDAAFDAVISRVGLIYFPDRAGALAGMRAALRPGGRLSTVAYATAERNRFFSVPVGIVRRRARLPPPAAGQPGPFSLSEPGVAETALTAAGFRDVTVETVPSPLRMASSAECLRFEQESFGALHQMLAGLSASEQQAAWTEVGRALAEFDGPDGFVAPCDMLVVSGTRP